MKTLIYIVLYILSICRHGHFFKQEKFNYIQTKFKETMNVLNPFLINDVEVKIDFYNKTTSNLLNFGESHVFRFSNETNLLLGSNIYTWNDFNGFEMNISYSLTDIEDEVTLIRTHEGFQDKRFILTSFKNGISNIYLLKNNEAPKQIQSLKNEGEIKDATFFINKNSLYLVIVNTKVTIYKYLKEYFDQIKTIPIKSSKISTFTHQDFEVLAFLNDISPKEKSIILYQFNENLKKIQFIKTPNLSNFEIHNLEFINNVYMIVFAGKSNFIYTWDYLNIEFVNKYEFESKNDVRKSVLVKKEIPLLFLISTFGIESFKLSLNNMQRLESFKFDDEFEKIFEVVEKEDELEIFVKGSEKNDFKVVNVKYFVHVAEIVSSVSYEDPIENCLFSLHDKLEDELNHFSTRKIKKRSDMNVDLEPDFDPFSLLLGRLNSITNDLKKSIDEAVSKTIWLENGVIDKGLIIKNNLNSNSLIVENVNVNTINNVEWKPEKWLSYTKEQFINNPIHTNELKSKNVEVKNLDIKDLILNEETIIINKLIKINNLKCNELFTNSLNGIDFKDIYLKNTKTPVKGLKVFNQVKIKNLESSKINYPNCFNNSKNIKYEFEPNLEVKNLHVETINKVNWDEFKDKLFQIGKTTKINGNLTSSKIIANKLQTKKINGLNVEDFLTKNTNQSITSKFIINKAKIHQLNVTKVNGIDFNKEIVDVNSTQTIVEGPIKIKSKTPNINKTTHYDKIKIIGDLRVKSINLTNDSLITIKDKNFNLNISNEFWLKNTNQTIVKSVKIKNATINDLKVKTINKIDVKDYFLMDKNCTFKDLYVKGDIKLNVEKENSPNWIDLNDNVVRKSGGYKITGNKVFNGSITVLNANIDYLNNIRVDDLPTIHSNDFDDYTFKKILVKGKLNLKKTTVNKLNNEEITKIKEGFKFIDEELKFKELNLKNVKINDLKIEENLNDKNLPNYIKEINKIYEVEEIKNVTSEGNINVRSIKNVKSINGVNAELMEEAVRKGAIMTGNVTFKKEVFIKNLFIGELNNINFPNLMEKLLFKDGRQIILGKYHFNIIRTNNLISKFINNYNLDGLIDIKRKSSQVLKGNFDFKSVEFLDSLKGKLICNLKDVINFYKTPQMKIWKSVTINGNFIGINNILEEITQNIVRLDQDNVINSPVTFKSSIHFTNINSKKGINQLNLTDIYEDALLKNLNDQLITGHKTFKKLTCAHVQVNGNSDIPIVNTIIIKNINDSLITKDFINKIKIKGHKIFKSGLKAKNLTTSNLSGLNPANLVNLDDLKSIPNAIFHTLDVVGILKILHVNVNIDFPEFLLNRLRKRSEKQQDLFGVYYFDHMEIRESFQLKKLNGVCIADVFKNNKIGQDLITGSKNFLGKLKVKGNVTIEALNSIDVINHFKDSVFYQKPSTFSKSVLLRNVLEVKEDINADKINGYLVEDIKKILNSNEINFKTNQIDGVIKEIEEIVKNNNIEIKNMPQEFMYLEKFDQVQINLPNTISAEVIERNDSVLINIIGDEPGNNCNLPKSCNCQHQSVLRISKDYSLQTLGHKAYEKVFSFQSDRINAHLITYTVSYSRVCTKNLKGNISNYESTILTWTDLKGFKTYVKYNLTDGFITGAKYFEYMEDVYLVITRFYESSLETHNLDCIIYKFGHSEDSVELIQKISTKGAWTLHLFNSPHGLILVIGNIYDSRTIISGTSTDIYVFNPHIIQFELLRHFLGAGAISITDVVLKEETQIILAQRDSPLVILKHNPIYNNFYIFQSIHLDSEIISVSRFYLGGESAKDAYLNVVTETNQFFLYVYKHVEGWKLESQGEIDGLRSLVPFNLNGNVYLLAPSTKLSSLLTVKKHG